jgi:hypothetical protein
MRAFWFVVETFSWKEAISFGTLLEELTLEEAVCPQFLIVPVILEISPTPEDLSMTLKQAN